MTVLITGGSGFVGLNLAQHLLEAGEDVVLFGPAPPPETARQALAGLRGRLSVALGDVRVAADLDAAIEGLAVDRLVHGAAITADLERERRAARDIFEVNTLGTVQVLEAALRHGLRRTVQLGTGSIFGAAARAAPELDERETAPLPESLYGISKYAAERTALRYRETRGLNVSVARLGMVFGPWEYDTGVRDTSSLPLQLLLAARAGTEAVYARDAGDDWVYARDVARGLAALLDLAHSPEPVYHLSAGMRWPIDAWCACLQRHYPGFRFRASDVRGECTVGRDKPPARAPMRIDRLRRDADYAPAYLIERSVEDFVAWREAFPEYG